jgi:tetratricopeptide (TPR) repeat protein
MRAMRDEERTVAHWIDEGDASMRAGRYADAQRAYQAAWPLSKGAMEPVDRVWLLLSIAHASIAAGDFEEAFEACAGAQNGFASTGVVAGNPLFHLLAGLASHGLGESHERVIDHFARALICGGPDIFKNEDPRHLEHLRTILQPPSETGTWDGYEGCSRDLLNGARGYLAELLTERLGQPPPYSYP